MDVGGRTIGSWRSWAGFRVSEGRRVCWGLVAGDRMVDGSMVDGWMVG